MIRVLVIDDSLFMRRLISDMLASDPEIEVVGTAKGGQDGLRQIPKTRPDCVTLDLVMPGWDGLTTLERIVAEYAIPCVVLSAYGRKEADLGMRCLAAGAVSLVLKPSGELSLDVDRVRDRLLGEIKAAAQANRAQLGPINHGTVRRTPGTVSADTGKMIVIGASTGGPQALAGILPSLPPGYRIPIVVVQHSPSSFLTESLAERLNATCSLPVKVAQDQETVTGSCIYLAPAGFETTVKPQDTGVIACVAGDGSGGTGPSIDVTMNSVAEVFQGNAVGVILTGLGHDGLAGMKAIKKSGGSTIVQDASALIFGMPKVVIDAGIADRVLPMHGMAEAMRELSLQ